MIHCSLQTSIIKKVVLWQGNCTYNAVVKFDMYGIFAVASCGSSCDSTAFLFLFPVMGSLIGIGRLEAYNWSIPPPVLGARTATLCALVV